MTNVQEILVSDELLRPHAKHGHGNPGDAFAPPPVFLRNDPSGASNERKTHTRTRTHMGEKFTVNFWYAAGTVYDVVTHAYERDKKKK